MVPSKVDSADRVAVCPEERGSELDGVLTNERKEVMDGMGRESLESVQVHPVERGLLLVVLYGPRRHSLSDTSQASTTECLKRRLLPTLTARGAVPW